MKRQRIALWLLWVIIGPLLGYWAGLQIEPLVATAASKHQVSFTAQTSTGATSAVDFDTLAGTWPDKLTVQLNTAGSPATCTYKIEGSLDCAAYFDLSGSITCTSNVMKHIVEKPVRCLRGNLTDLTGGTSPSVTLFVRGVSR